MTIAYSQMVFALSQNLKTFEKSIESCDIHKMLDENVTFVETLRNVNNTFESLPSKVKSAEIKAHNQSKELVRKYFGAKNRIYDACSCTSASHRSQIQ
jgi:hypothetical protein